MEDEITKIRIEVHTRIRFASVQYHKYIVSYANYNLDYDTETRKFKKTGFKRLSGPVIRKLPNKLAQALRIYDYYSKEYNDTLDLLNSKK